MIVADVLFYGALGVIALVLLGDFLFHRYVNRKK